MYIPFFAALGAAVLAGQLLLCFRCKKLLHRLIPAIGILACQGVCGIVYAWDPGPYGAVFAAAVYLMLLAFLLAADGIAWLVFGMIRVTQKVRK